MKTAYDIVTSKTKAIISVNDDTTIYEALSVMAEKKIGTVMITTDGKISGIWSERDLIRNIVKDGIDLKTAKIGSVMNKNLQWVTPEATLYEMMEKMITNKIRHLLVKNNGIYAGLVSIGEVITYELKERTGAVSGNIHAENLKIMIPAQQEAAKSTIKFEDRFSYDAAKNLFHVNFKDFTINNKVDVGRIEFMVASHLSGIGKKVHALVNYENFTINSETVEEYTTMINRLMEHFYKDVTRYTTSRSIQAQLETALKKANVTPNIFESSDEADKVLRTLL